MKEFVDYTMSFYAKGKIYDIGATREEVWEATCIRIKRCAASPLKGISFEGDSFDREAVRDIILEVRSNNMCSSEGKTLICPKCDKKWTAYHMDWIGTICMKCDSYFDKHDWIHKNN